MSQQKNVNDLPSEALLKIFHYLNWNDLKICEEVCSGWKVTAHEVSELKWKDLCRREFGQIYEDAFRKAHLSWEDLHKSLRSWSQAKSSKVFVKYSELLENRYVIPEEKDKKLMQFLKNGVIGYPYYIVDEWEPLDFTGEAYSFTTICYYDADTLQMIDSVNYDFKFDHYEENDDLIVLREDEMKLYIITKSNKRLHCVGEMLHSDFIDRTRFFLVGNRVFYMTMDFTLWMSRLVLESGIPTIESSVVAAPEVGEELDLIIQAVSFTNEKQVNLLTTKGDILSIVDKELKLQCHVERKDHNVVIDTLQQYGFFWNAPEVYSWMCCSSGGLAVTHLKEATVQSYGPVVLIGTVQRVLHIYYNPYRNGKLKLYKTKPTLLIDLKGWVPTAGAWPRQVSDSQRKINQIEVTEIKDGHRIVLLYCQRLVAIEIRLDALKRSSQPPSVTLVGARDGDYTRII